MNEGVLHFTKCPQESVIASVRIARFVSETLNVPLIDTATKAKYWTLPDRVYVVNSVFKFCEWRLRATEIIQRAKEVVWIQNDYAIEIRRVLRRPDLILWTTIPSRCKSPKDSYVNWNVLTYKPIDIPDYATGHKGLFYYGAYREGREKAFKKFFAGASDYYDVNVSAPMQAAQKFETLNPAIRVFRPFSSLLQIQDFQAAIYLEDEYSTRQYCSPANRFYECLAAGIPMCFDKATAGTMKKAGITVLRYTVNSKEDVKAFLKTADRALGRRQRKEWAREHWVSDLRDQVLALRAALDKNSSLASDTKKF